MTLPLMPPLPGHLPGGDGPATPVASALSGLLPPVFGNAIRAAMADERKTVIADKIKSRRPVPEARQERDKIYPYITQHCVNGAHEKSSLVTDRGNKFQACRGTYTWRFTQAVCTCWCHEMFASMKAEDSDALLSVSTDTITPVSAVSVDARAPEPAMSDTPPATPSSTPTTPDTIRSNPLYRHPVYRNVIDGDNIESQLAHYVWVNVFQAGPPPRETVLGRRKRGELDAQVELVCRLWLDGHLNVGPQLTINWICMMINAERPPSPGAIYAVLTRWADANLCMVGTKPFRFTGFSDPVNQDGIMQIRKDNKREAARREKGHF